MTDSKPSLLIIYSKNPNEVFNRKSAIGSYVFSLAQLLQTNFQVFLNDRSFSESENYAATDSVAQKATIIGKIKKLIPKKIKARIRDRHHLKSIDQLSNSILNLNIKFDCVLEFYNFGSDVGLRVKQKYGSALTLIYDGPILEEYHFFNGHETSLANEILDRQKKSFYSASHIVVYSKPMRDYCCVEIDNNSDKYHYHQNIDFSRFRIISEDKPKNKNLQICFVGSFLKWHRVKDLIRIFNELYPNNAGDSPELFLVGDGEEKKSCEEYAKRIGNSHIHFTGFLDGAQLENLQKKMDIGIMPGSNWYGAPNKIFEYGAQKMACIAPATPTIKYLFQNDEVLLFEPDNFDSLKQSIRKLIEDKELRLKMAENLNQFIIRNYSIEKTRDFYTEIVSNAIRSNSISTVPA